MAGKLSKKFISKMTPSELRAHKNRVRKIEALIKRGLKMAEKISKR